MRIAPFLMLSCSLAMAVLAACGGGGGKPVLVGPLGDGGAGGEAGASVFATTPPPSGLPPVAPMPPPGVVGSKKAKVRTDEALFRCQAAASSAAKDPADEVKRLGEACASASKMTPLGPPLRGRQGDTDPHAEHPFRVEANKCYRVYLATGAGAKYAVAVVRDSAGDVVAESRGGAAVPHDGAMCFTAADSVTLSIGVGSGSGTYAAQVWGGG